MKDGVTWQTMLGRATFVIKKTWHTYNQVSCLLYPVRKDQAGQNSTDTPWLDDWIRNILSNQTLDMTKWVQPGLERHANKQMCSGIRPLLYRSKLFFLRFLPGSFVVLKTNKSSFQGFFLVLQVAPDESLCTGSYSPVLPGKGFNHYPFI